MPAARADGALPARPDEGQLLRRRASPRSGRRTRRRSGGSRPGRGGRARTKARRFRGPSWRLLCAGAAWPGATAKPSLRYSKIGRHHPRVLGPGPDFPRFSAGGPCARGARASTGALGIGAARFIDAAGPPAALSKPPPRRPRPAPPASGRAARARSRVPGARLQKGVWCPTPDASHAPFRSAGA